MYFTFTDQRNQKEARPFWTHKGQLWKLILFLELPLGWLRTFVILGKHLLLWENSQHNALPMHRENRRIYTKMFFLTALLYLILYPSQQTTFQSFCLPFSFPPSFFLFSYPVLCQGGFNPDFSGCLTLLLRCYSAVTLESLSYPFSLMYFYFLKHHLIYCLRTFYHHV